MTTTFRRFAALRATILTAALASLWVLTGCPTDLFPEGWEEATEVDEMDVTDLGETDPEDPDVGTVAISGNLDRLEVQYIASFPCSDDLRAYQVVEGTDVDILVQPDDLHPDAVTGSDCTTQLQVTLVDLPEGTYQVAVYRRDNDQVDPDMEPVLVAEGEAILGFAE